MPRIQLAAPDRYAFATEVQVYISHVNQGGHLDNAQLLTLVSEGRVRFFRWLGYAERSIEQAQIVVADMVALYKSEAFYGEQLSLRMTPRDLNKYGFDLVYELREKATGREVALGKIGVVFVSPSTRRPVEVPPAFLARLAQAGAEPA
ncbi:MAG: thioesterase family protein [Burkholderiaceae bacterium]